MSVEILKFTLRQGEKGKDSQRDSDSSHVVGVIDARCLSRTGMVEKAMIARVL